MFIQEQYLELARKIHQENPVVDAHFDLAAEVYERHLTGESGVVEQRYLPRFEEAGLNIVVSSIFINNRDLPELGLRKALGQITALKEDIEPVGDRIRVTKSRAELDENLAAGRISVLLSLEGLDPLGNDLSLLRTFYDLGVRGAGLTWSRRNAFATGCCTCGAVQRDPGWSDRAWQRGYPENGTAWHVAGREPFEQRRLPGRVRSGRAALYCQPLRRLGGT